MVQETICGKNAAHTLAYSLIALQEMNLAYNYPIIFWDTANLIVDSGAMNLEEQIFNDDEDDDEDKLKNSSTDYGKVASAIGKMKSRGLSFSLPDINKSKITFSPDLEKNQILYGLRGITRVGNQLIKEIIDERPYTGIDDFLNKVKVNKTQMISLIKSGVFDMFYEDRTAAMDYYLNLIADKKKRITLQNMQMLINYDLIPPDLYNECKIFNFNKYLKSFKDGDYYCLDDRALNFFLSKYDETLLKRIKVDNSNKTGTILQATWDCLYKKAMDPVRKWMKENQKEILDKLNNTLYQEVKNKYAEGSISKWEMDSLSFYSHDHELLNLKNEIYNIENFEKIKDNEIENHFTSKDGNDITIFKIHRIAGTVIDKDRNKNTITLLTTTGVVVVKVWKSQFAAWDKQISQKDEDGIKHIIEKSWFTRGNKLIITGIKRDGVFVPKKYKNTTFPLFEKIKEIDNKGFIISSSTERAEEEE